MARASLSDMMIALSQRHPDRLAVDSPTRNLTYAQFVALSSQAARELAARGIEPRMRVGIANRRNEDTLVLMCAMWMLGVVAVAMDFRTRAPERAALARDFELAAILEDRAVDAGGAYRAIVTDADWDAAVAAQPGGPVYSPPVEAPALIALTSGSSGERMGVLVDHASLYIRANMPLGLISRDQGGRMLMLGSLSFSAAMHITTAHLVHGGTVVYVPALFGVEELSRFIVEKHITSFTAVPTVMRGLLEIHRDRDTPAFPALRCLCVAGAPAAAQEKRLARRVLSASFIEVYASALTGRIAVLDVADVEAHAESVGRVIPLVNVEVVDAHGRVLPAGEPGAIRVRSPSMSTEVCGPGSLRQRGDRVADGWVHTGDVGRVDGEGFLHLLGRDSEMIIRGGENIYPAELEAVALELAGVKEAVAVGFPSERVGEEIGIFVVAEPHLAEHQLMAHFRSRLTPNKVPRTIRLVAVLHKNENNKVDYPALKKELMP